QSVAALASSLQLAPSPRQPQLPTTCSPTRPISEQPIGFTHLVVLVLVVALGPALARMRLHRLPVAGHEAITAAHGFPAVADPGVSGPLDDRAAAHPDVTMAVPPPISRRIDVTRPRRGRRLDDGNGRRDTDDDVYVHARLRD